MRLALATAAVASASVARVAPPLPMPTGHGINIHFTREQQGELRQISVAGFTFVRMDLVWGEVEADKGVYNWSAYDALTTSLAANNLRGLLILNGGNCLYDGCAAPASDPAVTAFTRFAVASVGRYARAGHVFETFNEPDIGPACPGAVLSSSSPPPSGPGSGRPGAPLGGWTPCVNATAYARLAVSVGAAVKAAYPEELLIGPALGQYWNATSGVLGPNYPFLDVLAAAGALSYWDGLSLHPYRPSSPEDNVVEYAGASRWLDAASPPGHVPALVAGEVGWSTAPLPHTVAPLANETTQAHWTVRQRLVDMISNVSLTIAYDYVDDGDNASYIEDRFGLVTRAYLNASLPHAPKPAFVAARALHFLFQGCAFTGALNLSSSSSSSSPRCYAAYWDCGFQSPAFAAWCDAWEGWSGTLTFPYTFPSVEGAAWAPSHPELPGLLTRAAPSPSPLPLSLPPRSSGPCFYLYTTYGVDTGLVCSTGGGGPTSYEWVDIGVGPGPVYLRDVQL